MTTYNTNTISPNIFGTCSPISATTSIPYTISNGTGSYSYNIPNSITANIFNPPSNVIAVNGKDADIKINGKSLSVAIEKIEERLAILHPNPMLEERWEELKQLGDQYRKLEAEIIEKEKIWHILEK